MAQIQPQAALIKKNQLKIIVLFVGISACIVLAGINIYHHWKITITSERQRELLTITDLKVKQITDWRNDRLAYGAQIGNSPFLIKNIYTMSEKPP